MDFGKSEGKWEVKKRGKGGQEEKDWRSPKWMSQVLKTWNGQCKIWQVWGGGSCRVIFNAFYGPSQSIQFGFTQTGWLPLPQFNNTGRSRLLQVVCVTNAINYISSVQIILPACLWHLQKFFLTQWPRKEPPAKQNIYWIQWKILAKITANGFQVFISTYM